MSLRISSGLYQNRELLTPEDIRDNSPVRPTKARVREAMLNMVIARRYLEECTVLDLFCGSGALGLEALSRGAVSATFVDADVKWTRKNIEKLCVDNATATQADAITYKPSAKADIIFADPPYGLGLLEKVMENAEQYGEKDSLWVLELEHNTDLPLKPEKFTLLKEKKYGKSRVVLLEQK